MKPLRLPWQGRDVPYAMLDVIRGCNCVCKACYNRTHTGAKPLDAIERDLDVIFAQRRVEFVGILGGEPLLHPELTEIVRRIKARGVGAVMLTNGILWDTACASRLAAAGLEMVFLHIQQGQQRPDLPDPDDARAVEALIREKCAVAAAAGLRCAVSTTVRVDQPDALADTLRFFRTIPDCSHAFLTLERSMQTIDRGVERFSAANGLRAFVETVAPLGWRPFAGIGGHVDARSFRWLVFHAFQSRDASGRETGFAALPPSLFERALFALLGRHLPLRVRSSRAGILVRFALNALTGGPIRNLAFLLRVLLRRERLVAKNLFVESFPDLLPDGRVEYCDPCLDAVVQDGQLVPPCLSDTDFAKGDNPCRK